MAVFSIYPFPLHTLSKIDGKLILEPRNLFTFIPDVMLTEGWTSSQFWANWQEKLRQVAQINQKGLCPITAGPLQLPELHHALISRADVRGMPEDKQVLIHNTYNCLLVSKTAHEHVTRQEAAIILKRLYGPDVIEGWYWSFPFKTRQKNIF